MSDAPDSLCALFARAVQAHPARPAVVTDGEAVTYAELGRRAQEVAGMIAGAAGDNPRVALLSEGGGLGVMVYGEYGRTGVYTMQSMLRRLAGGRPPPRRPWPSSSCRR